MRSSRSTAQGLPAAARRIGPRRRTPVQSVAGRVSTRGGRTSRAGGGRSSRPAAGRAARWRRRELDVDVLARARSVAGRAAVGRATSTGSSPRAVVDRQHVARRHDQRARGERVRRDEGDDVALHAPGQHRAAVGEVVARGALRGGDHEAVAADARRSPRPRPRRPARRRARPGGGGTEMSLTRDPLARRGGRRESPAARSCRTRRRSARAKPLLEARRARSWPGSRSRRS